MLQPHPPIRWSPFWLTILGTTGLMTGSLAVFFGAGAWSVTQPWAAGAVMIFQAALLGVAAWKLTPVQATLSSRQRTGAAAISGAVAAVSVLGALLLRNVLLAQVPAGALIGFNLGEDEWTVARTTLSLIGGCSLLALAAGAGHALTRRSSSPRWQRISKSLYQQAAVGMVGAVALYVALNGRSWGLIQQALA